MKESFENMELFWKRSSMKKKTIRTFVGIYRSLLTCLAAVSFVAFCVSEIVGIKNFNTTKNSGLKEIRLSRDRNIQYILHSSTLKMFIYLRCTSD